MVSHTFGESTKYQNLSRIALVVEAGVQEGTQALLRPRLGSAHCHIFSVLLLTKAKHKTSPNSRDGKTKGIDVGICKELEPFPMCMVENLNYPSTLHSSIVIELQPAT